MLLQVSKRSVHQTKGQRQVNTVAAFLGSGKHKQMLKGNKHVFTSHLAAYWHLHGEKRHLAGSSICINVCLLLCSKTKLVKCPVILLKYSSEVL